MTGSIVQENWKNLRARNLDWPQTYDILSYLILLPRDSVSYHLACCLPASSVSCIQCLQPTLVTKPVSEAVHIWAVLEAALADNPSFPTESIHGNPC